MRTLAMCGYMGAVKADGEGILGGSWYNNGKGMWSRRYLRTAGSVGMNALEMMTYDGKETLMETKVITYCLPTP